MRVKSALLLAAALCLIFAAGARAESSLGQITLTFDGVVPAGTTNISMDSGSTWEDVYAGQYTHTLTPPTGSNPGAATTDFAKLVAQQANSAHQLTTFCIDVHSNISGGQTWTYDIYHLQYAPLDSPYPAMGATRAAQLELLMGIYESMTTQMKSNAGAMAAIQDCTGRSSTSRTPPTISAMARPGSQTET